MKNLSKEELLDRIHKKRDATYITYEALTDPDYNTWGRARFWTVNQAVCLLAGLWPICKEYFEILIKARSVIALAEWFSCYPVQQTDLNRLKNTYRLVNEWIPLKDRERTHLCFSPQQLLDECKKDELVKASLPAQLVKVVEKLGAHTDLDLPDSFHFLEINPETMRKMKRLEAVPLDTSKIPEKREVLASRESPIEIARRLFPLQNKEKWEKAETLTPCEIVLLHYEIEPVDILTQYHFIPCLGMEKEVEELLTHIAEFFQGDRKSFVLEIDEKDLWDLLRRAIAANSLSLAVELPPPFYASSIKKDLVCRWMKDKGFSFPIYEEERKAEQFDKRNEKELILSYDLSRLDNDQLARLVFRGLAVTIWKTDPHKKIKDILDEPLFKNTLKAFCQEIHRKSEHTLETKRGWISDLIPRKTRK